MQKKLYGYINILGHHVKWIYNKLNYMHVVSVARKFIIGSTTIIFVFTKNVETISIS